MALTPTQTANTGVATKRKELRDKEEDYKLIDDCIAGERQIKRRGDKYLPRPNANDESEENLARYEAYRDRAVFYNVAQRTLSGMVGEVFARDPVVEIPDNLNIVGEDADGSGLTLTQIAKRGVRYTLAMGRAGVLADFPAVENGVTKADVEQGDVQPTITVYKPINVINWRTVKYGSKTYLSLVVLREEYDDGDDGFAVTKKTQYRVLRLRDGVYTVQIYREGARGDEIAPTDAAGKTFEYIPFMFIGSENNDAEIDYPPMLDLATINVAHYRNSADYEESAFMVGQPTPVFAGLTEHWVKEVLGGTVHLGSRGGVSLPEGGTATLLQMEPNSVPFEAMMHKERQMISLGAKLVEQKEVQRTATEANIENASETSVLADVAKNVSAAIKFALEVCARYAGVDSSAIVYVLNTEFNIANLTPSERQQLIAEWLQGAISFTEMRTALRKTGVATLDDEEARKEIEEEDVARALKLEDDEDDDNKGNKTPDGEED